MSSIIDNILFKRPVSEQMKIQKEEEGLSIPFQLFRHFKNKDPTFLISHSDSAIQASKKIALQQEDFHINICASKLNQRIKITVILLQSSAFYRTISKQSEILMMKELIKRLKDFSIHGSIYVHKGRLVMLIDLYFILYECSFSLMNKVYSQVILKNILSYEEILGKYLKIGKKARRQIGKLMKNDEALMYSRILNTTQTNFQISDEKSQFKYAKRQSKKQESQLKQIKINILQENSLEKNIKTLFKFYPEEIQAVKIQAGFQKFIQEKYDDLRMLILPEIPNEKKVEDYLYNVIDIVASEKAANGNPIGQGGVCSIFALKVRMAFLNNIKEAKQNGLVDKIVAVKMLRQDMQRKKERIHHQNQIVSKFSNSTCYYLPKYYSCAKMPDFVIMERLVGEELDFFVEIRSEYISLWTKIYLLINVLKGIRHLISLGVAHLDLKPINILVCKFMTTKIIDFGEAYHPSICQKGIKFITQDYNPGFTFPYVAPEVFQRIRKQASIRQPMQFGQSQDVFAFGIILSQILFKSSIFNLSSSKFQEVYLKNETICRYFITPQKNIMYGQDNLISILMYIVSRCIDPDPSSRPRFQWINIILELIIESYINS